MTSRLTAGIAVALVGVLASSRPAAAQYEVPRADSLLRAGQLHRAEALYYAAARRRPRDPDARFALGRYLASRGALRVGAVLVEEAVRFGGAPAHAAQVLGPIYSQLGEFGALVRLPQARFAPGELSRARALHENPPTTGGPDSARIPLLPNTVGSSFGAVRLIVGGDTVLADIDPTVEGVVLDRQHIRTVGVRSFDAGAGSRQPGIVGRATLGPYVLRNLPVTLTDLGGAGRARVGLDWLARWAPTIDRGFTRTLTLRRSGRVPPGVVTVRTARIPYVHGLPMTNGDLMPGPWIIVPGGIARLDAAEVGRLRTGRVTLDSRRGELLVDR